MPALISKADVIFFAFLAFQSTIDTSFEVYFILEEIEFSETNAIFFSFETKPHIFEGSIYKKIS